MVKTYTVSPDSTYIPARIQIGGHRARSKIYTIPNPPDQRGPALYLNQALISTSVHVRGAGNKANIAFSAAKPAIYTTGLFQCFALCVMYNKTEREFGNGYLAHVSNPRSSFFNTCLQDLPNPKNTELWAVVSVGSGGWERVIAQRLLGLGIANDHICIYIRQNPASNFGIDRFGNFGEI